MGFQKRLLALALLALSGCYQTERTYWSSRAVAASRYHAILYQTVYNGGETAEYQIRLQRDDKQFSKPPCGDGWYIKKQLDGDLPYGDHPQLLWTSPDDLTVVVPTQKIEGQVVQRFHDVCGPDGSLTIVYKAGN
jgi:hypothetical protein